MAARARLAVLLLALHATGAAAQEKAPMSPPAGATAEPASDARIERARRLFERGRDAYTRGSLPEAREAFEQAFEAAPSPELAFNLARACERLGARPCAIAHFRYFLKRGAPPKGERKRVEERVLALEAELAEARREHAAAAPTDQELTAEARSFFMRGLALYKRGRYRAAYQAFVAARRFAPTPEVLYNMARAAERLGRAREASDLYGAYLRARPKASDRSTVEGRIAKLRAR